MSIQRICIVAKTSLLPISSLKNQLGILTQALLDQGVHVKIFTPNPSAQDTINNKKIYSNVFTIKRQITTFKPQIILVTDTGLLALLAIKTGQKLGIPTVSEYQTRIQHYLKYNYLSCLIKPLNTYLDYFHDQVQAVITHNLDHQKSLQKKHINTACLVDRSVDNLLFNPQKRNETLRKQWELDPADDAVIYAGEISNYKDINLAITAYKKMKRCDPCLKFILIGDGDKLSEIRSTHRDIIYCGIQEGESLAKHYSSADILLFPSKTTNTGSSILEAMASGLAIICFENTITRELINDDFSGFLVESSNNKETDEKAFLEKATYLIRNPEKIKKMKNNARITSMNRNANTELKQYTQIFDQLLINQNNASCCSLTSGQRPPIPIKRTP